MVLLVRRHIGSRIVKYLPWPKNQTCLFALGGACGSCGKPEAFRRKASPPIVVWIAPMLAELNAASVMWRFGTSRSLPRRLTYQSLSWCKELSRETAMPEPLLRAEYAKVKRLCAADWKSAQAGDAILELAVVSLRFLLDQCHSIDLISRVPGKRYFTFKRDNVFARPANDLFFVRDLTTINTLWSQWLKGTISPANFARLTYTVRTYAVGFMVMVGQA